MAYFECVHGTVHYPFGKGGRENLLRGCATLAQTATDTPSPNKATTAYDRIRECPFHSLPLSEALNASVVLPSSEAGGHLTEVAREMQGGAAQNHSQSEVPAGISPHASGTTYKKDVASTNSAISAIADDMICEIFKSQIQAVLVSLLFLLHIFLATLFIACALGDDPFKFISHLTVLLIVVMAVPVAVAVAVAVLIVMTIVMMMVRCDARYV